MSRVNHNLELEFPIEKLREYVYYDPDKGDLFWHPLCEYVSDGINKRRGMTPVGKPQQRGYRLTSITFNGRKFCLMVCRMTWAVVHGEWPSGNMFFRDGDKTNVNINNMIHISPRVNHIVGRYRKLIQSRSAQIKQQSNGRWCATCAKIRRVYDTFEEARKWRNETAQKRIDELLPDLT